MRSSLPERIDLQHHVLTRKYAVWTPPMDEMIRKIGDWIDMRIPGGYIFGPSRFGKTRCVQRYLRNVLTERFHRAMPLIIWNHRPVLAPGEADFWHKILIASAYDLTAPEKPPKKTAGFAICKNRFKTLADISGNNFVVLLIDEAQYMSFQEWKWLSGLQNDLDYDGYVLSVFSIGSHQIDYQPQYMSVTGNAHLAARFMVEHERFRGIESQRELGYVLNGYDEDSEWPEGSGISYLKYFSPADFRAGRRLRDIEKIFWSALNELSPNKRAQEFPMQHIANAIEEVLCQLAIEEDWGRVVEYKNILKIIGATGFSDHMRFISEKM